MSETGFMMGSIGEGQHADGWMFSNFLWMLMLSLLIFGKDKKPDETEKEGETNGQQPVPSESDE